MTRVRSTERFEKVPIDKLVPYARNARTHSKEQIAQLRASIREFGFLIPCLVDGKYNIIAGHGRVLAAREEGIAEIPCVFAEHLTDAQKRAYILADNRLALNAGWDEEMLSVELADLQGADFDLSLLGFDDAELNKLLGGAEEVQDDDFDVDAALKLPTFVLPGDLWHLANHRLLCGDSTKPEDVARLMDGKQANICLTDAPYNVNFDGGKGKILNDNMPKEQFYSFLLAAFQLVYEHLADGGAFYCFHSDSEKVNFYNATVAAGFHYSTTCIWVKDSLVLGRGDFQQMHEPCLYSFKDTRKHAWYADRKQTTVWKFDRPKKSEYHSTQKPVPLMAYPLTCSTQANAIVYEPFAGSFSTGIAYEQLNRICFGMELDPKFASAAVRRWIDSYGEDGVTAERDGKILLASEVMSAP